MAEWRRSAGLLAVAVILISGGTVAALSESSEPTSSGPALRIAPLDEEIKSAVLERIQADALLSTAPWLFQPKGSPSLETVEPKQSFVFNSPLTYSEALTELYTAVAQDGRLPGNGHLAPPLPPGKVIALYAGETRLSLTAPFGYDIPTGNILPPSIELPGAWSAEQVRRVLEESRAAGLPIPTGGRVSVPELQQCQIQKDASDVVRC